MALTRKFLSAMGIEADKIDNIIDAHTETVEALKKERDAYKSDAEKLPEVQAELKKAQEAAKNSGDAEKIQKHFDDYKAQVEAEKTKSAKETALRKVAKDAGLTDAGIAKAVKYADWNSIELDEKGEIKDAKSMVKALKEEWPEHIGTTKVTGAQTSTPPAGGSGKKYASKDEIMAIKDTAERQAAIAENHELFGF